MMVDEFRIHLPASDSFIYGSLSGGDRPFPYDESVSWATPFLDKDGTKVYEGDHMIAVHGHYSQKKYKALHVTIKWSGSFFCLLWSDGYQNAFPINDLSHFRVVSNRFISPHFHR